MEVQIRRINPQDQRLIRKVSHLLAAEIYEEENRRGVHHRWMNDYLQDHPWCQVFAAFHGRKLVGAIVWGVSDASDERVSLELDFIAVREDLQQSGIGRRLVRETLRQFVEGDVIFEGFEIATVFVVSSAGSKGFYEKVFKPFKTVVIPDVWEYDGEEKDQAWFWARPETVLGE
ncbi:MAG: GNAT family N-acetyltransferase [Parcubacteria group bacterium]|nr:GNAT family N-acetyltransferase [Parcubacteria group bacterium]